MQTTDFRAWLEQRKPELKQSTVNTLVTDAKRVERYYGDLDKLYAEDRLDSVLQELRYSATDAQKKAPNPSKIPISPASLSGYRTAITRYREYVEESAEGVNSDEISQADDDGRGRLIGLERDLQAALRDSIEQLEPGLDIIDGGTERSVASGFIDITATAPDGTIVVVELKAGTARRDAIGQILSYMGDVAAEETNPVRGILVAGDFDNKARAAARVVPSLSLRRYSVTFEFSPAEITST